MRILFTSKQFIGHVLPLLPFAHSFSERGHEVLFAAPERAGAILSRAGLDHAPFDAPSENDLNNIWTLALEDTSVDLPTAAGRIFTELNMDKALPKLRETVSSWKPDLVIRDSSEYAAIVAAAEAGIPTARIAVNNSTAEAEMLRLATPALDIVLRPTAHLRQPSVAISAEPAFSYFPPSLDPWENRSGLAEPMRVRTKTETTEPRSLPSDVSRDEGLPLIFITFGTLAAKLQKNYDILRSVIEAVEAGPVRALLSTGDSLDLDLLGAIPENVSTTRWVSPAEIYPRIKALICHGGSGTVIAGLSHSVPMVILPLAADQYDNARLVESSGAGISITEATSQAIHTALLEALNSADMRDAATKLAAEIKGLQIVDQAVDNLIDQYK